MKKLLLAILSTIVLIWGATSFNPSLAFDKTPGKFEFFEGKEYVDMSTTVVLVKTRGYGYGVYWHWDKEKQQYFLKKAIGTFDMQGMGTLKRSKNGFFYVITVAHVIEPTYVTIQLSAFNYHTTPMVELIHMETMIVDQNDRYGVCPLKFFYKDSELDLAVLKVQEKWASGLPIEYSIEHTYSVINFMGTLIAIEKLEKDDSIAMVTRKRNKDDFRILESWYEIRYGKVIDTGVWVPKEENILIGFKPADMTLEIRAYPGDSGSPVFAFNEGKPVFIGVLRGFLSIDNGYSNIAYATKLDAIATRIFGSDDY